MRGKGIWIDACPAGHIGTLMVGVPWRPSSVTRESQGVLQRSLGTLPSPRRCIRNETSRMRSGNGLCHGASLSCRLGISDFALDLPESGMVTT